jgi:hypothetical protein
LGVAKGLQEFARNLVAQLFSKGGIMEKFGMKKACLLFMVLLSVFIVLPGCGGGGDTCSDTSLKAITAFSFVGFPGNAGTINEAAKTIEVTLPFGTDVTNLVAAFTTTGTAVRVGSTVQTSGTTPNNFTGPVVYIVTAADGSTVAYTVNVFLASNSAKAITAFSFVGFPAATGVINEAAKTIAVTLPFGTNLTNLVAAFTTTGIEVEVGATVQTSGSTPNNFTNPVQYIVTAADSSTATYTVTVTVAPNSAKAITAYSFVGFTGATGVINEAAKTIAVTVPFGTDLTSLIATFTTTGTVVRVGATVQTSGSTANNFTNPVQYLVTAADSSTATYSVTVTVAPNSAKAITAYSFVGFTGATGVINEAAKTIAVTVPFGTDLTSLIATFTTTGTVVRVGATVQTSGSTANNFTNPVQYIVTAADSSTATYTVTVTAAPSSAKAITAYSFAGFTGAVGTIDEAASPKTITVPVPQGTDVTNLIATFTTTGTVVRVGTSIQTSTATTNNFTNTVSYVVTAADNSTATYNVTVIVTNAPELGAIAPFGGFGGPAGMTNQGLLTVINGDIGTTGASTLMTGFHDLGGNVYTETPLNQGFVNGTIYTATAPPGSVPGVVAAAAALAAQTAFDNLSPASLPGGTDPGAGQLGGLTLPAGIYQAAGGSFLLTGSDLTLDGGGDANAVFVFQTASSLTVGGPGAPRSIILINGAQAKNVFWYVGSAATINAAGGGTMVGTIIASAGVTFSTAGNVDIVTLNGRAIGLNASVTLVNTVINVPAP